MSKIVELLILLGKEMDTPVPFGWFHLLWIGIMLFMIFILYKLKNKYSEKQLKIVLFSYGLIAFILETLKQILWSFNYDSITNIVTWDFEWYSFPFQLCTTPIFVCLICCFLKKGKIRDSLFSYLSFFTILGSISTIFIPDSCFTSDILINIHTMWLHYGSFVVSIYLLMNKVVKGDIKSVFRGFIVFIIFVVIAIILNISVYHSGILNGETFNMFYISPYFISSLPVFDVIQQNMPYLLYLVIYIIALLLGAFIIYGVYYIICRNKKIKKKFRN